MRMNRALLVRLGALGDTVLASSVAGLLKKNFPGIEVDFLASAGLEELFAMLPEVTEVCGAPVRRLPLALHPILRQRLRRLNRKGYDLVYLMETNPRFLPLLDAIRAEKKIALGLLDEEGEPAEGLPVPIRYQRPLWDQGIVAQEVSYPKLSVREQDEEHASALLSVLGLDPLRPLIGLHPGNSFRTRKKWRRWMKRADLRSWPEQQWLELTRKIHGASPDVQFVLFGSSQDRLVNGRIERSLRKDLPGLRMASSAGRTNLPLAAALLKRFSLFVATDTGPLHMAAALNVPLIGLYGPTRFKETGPFTDQAKVSTIRKSLPCQPCYGGPMQRSCRNNRCMQEIQAEEVMQLIFQMDVLP